MNLNIKSLALTLGCSITLLNVAQAQASSTYNLKVKDHSIPCNSGAHHGDCLVVKKGCFGKWENFHTNIKGFDYKEGTSYKIKVKRTEKTGKLPADASAYNYELVKVINSKTTNDSKTVSSNKSMLPTDKMTITQINGKTAKSNKVSLTFDSKEGRYYGSAGCNNYSGTYTINGDKITCNPGMSTMMACGDQEIMNQESQIHAIFTNVLTFKKDGNNVSLINDKNQVLLKLNIPTLADKKAALSNQFWSLISLNNMGKDFQDAGIKFNLNEGKVSGNMGCNSMGGEVSVTDSEIKFGMMISTMKACLDKDMQSTESELLKEINKKTLRYELSGDNLTLYDGNRSVAIFTKKK